MRRVDLSAVAAVENNEPVVVPVGDREFKVHGDLRWNTAALWADDRLDEAIATLAVDPTEGSALASAILGDNPTKATAAARINAIMAAVEDADPVGEAPASSDS